MSISLENLLVRECNNTKVKRRYDDRRPTKIR